MLLVLRTIDRSAFYQQHQKFSRKLCLPNLTLFSRLVSLLSYVVIERVISPNMLTWITYRKISCLRCWIFKLNLLHNYLSNRKQRVRINDSFSEFFNVLLGVPRGSILGPLLFNTFINDLLLFERNSELCNFANDNTLYAVRPSVEYVKSLLSDDVKNVLYWFKVNQMVANPAKFQVMFLGTKDTNIEFLLENISIVSCEFVKLLGICIDKGLNFKHPRYAPKPLRRLKRSGEFVHFSHSKSLSRYIMLIFLSAFKYCLLIWMNFIKGNNRLIWKAHHKAWKLSTKTKEEIFKALHGLSPKFISEIFVPNFSGYDLRSGNQLTLPRTRTVSFGMRSLNFRGSLIWNRLPKSVKDSYSLNIFKYSIVAVSYTHLTLPTICSV